MRHILLVHPTRSIRALIKKYVFAELGDVEFVEAENGENALAELNMNPFDTVVATADLVEMSTVALRDQMAQTNHNAATPFIVLSEDESGTHAQTLSQQGFEHVVQIRVRPAELIQKINLACNPRQWRKDKRYYIPKTKVIIHAGVSQTDGALINISRGGLLLELITYEPDVLMREALHLTVRIPGPSDFYDIPMLPAKLSRLNITEWHLNNAPAAMRATFIFLELSPEQNEQIEQVLQLAVEDKLEEET
jgi:CheY-like chemotaxis protein